MRYVALFLLLLLLLAAGFSAYSFMRYHAPSVPAETTVFIPRGTGGRAMLDQLHREGVLPAPWTILMPVIIRGQHRQFKAGEYRFAAGLSPAHVLTQVLRGEVVVHSITIPEGWNVAQVRAALLREPLLAGDVPAMAEGSVAPDTVHFLRGDSRASVVQRLQREQQHALDEAWSKRAENLPFATPQEALVLASIVEAETGLDEERARVAAVYINRLRQDMPLQADPTVAYGLAPQGMDRPLSRADLKRETPYNTYLHPGLPPGPIGNPGRASITAALNPAQTDELYFVATGHGGHWFARTAEEHAHNVANYRAAERAFR